MIHSILSHEMTMPEMFFKMIVTTINIADKLERITSFNGIPVTYLKTATKFPNFFTYKLKIG